MKLRERLGASVADIRARGQRLVQLNLELLTAELREKGKKFGTAIGLFLGAGLLALYAIGFALTTIAVALALVLPLWLSLLIVTLVLFLIVSILALVGRDQLRKIGAPAPETTIAEAKATAELMKTNARDTATRVRERAVPPRDKGGPETPPQVAVPPATSAPPTGGPPPGGPPLGAPPSAGGPPPTAPPPPGPDAPASGPPSDTGARES